MAENFDIVFHGNDRSECIDFIPAVRLYAKNNGKIRDNHWIADELYTAFDGEAFGWYLTQLANVRADWELLEQALVVRWIMYVNDNAVATLSSCTVQPPAAAASTPFAPNIVPGGAYSGVKWTGKNGRIRLRVNGLSGARYLSKQGESIDRERLGCFDTTTDASLALKVRLIMAAPDTYRLELVEHESKLPVLAAFSYGSADWTLWASL